MLIGVKLCKRECVERLIHMHDMATIGQASVE